MGNTLAFFAGIVEASAQVHFGEWGLALLWWTPAAVSLTVGPFTIKAGIGFENFYGAGVSFYPKTRHFSAYLSSKLWWE